VGGIKLPYSLVSMGTSGGARYKFSAIELNVPVEHKLFELPPASPPSSPK
jgi:hypothetical protein